MPRFLVDENLPRSLVNTLTAGGYEATHVRDVGLRGKPDEDVFAYAVSNQLAIISCDLDFSDMRAYPLGTHAGIVVVRLPEEVSVNERKRVIVTALSRISEGDLAGSLVVIDPGGVRLRGKRKE